MLHTTLMIIHFFCAVAIVALVLVQRGKGAEAGAGFGAGASGTVFGARGASTALSRATAVLAAVFMVTSLSLTYVGTRKAAPSSSILEQLSRPTSGSTRPSETTLPAPTTAPAPTAPAPATAAPATATPAPAAPAPDVPRKP